MLVELEEHLKAVHKQFSMAAHQADDEESAGEDVGDVGDNMAGVPLEKIMALPKFRKLAQVMRQAKAEEAKRFAFIAHPGDPKQTRILLLAHATRHDPHGKTGWKPGFDPRIHNMTLEEV